MLPMLPNSCACHRLIVLLIRQRSDTCIICHRNLSIRYCFRLKVTRRISRVRVMKSITMCCLQMSSADFRLMLGGESVDVGFHISLRSGDSGLIPKHRCSSSSMTHQLHHHLAFITAKSFRKISIGAHLAGSNWYVTANRVHLLARMDVPSSRPAAK